MAIKGLSIPVFGKYNNANGVVTYTDGMINPHAVSYTVTTEVTENSELHGDNRVVESDGPRFSSGTLSLETDDLDQEISKYLLGLKEVERTYGEDKKVTAIVVDDDQESPELGFGIIEEHQKNNVDKYKAIILKRVKFVIPEDSATTRGKSIEWQTKTITANIMRSEEKNDSVKFPWQEYAWFESEGDALEYLKKMLGVNAA